MNLLIDTNIVIPLEPSSFEDIGINTDSAIQLHNLCNRSHNILCIHPAINYDIDRDTNLPRASLRRKLLGRYKMLEPFPDVAALDSTVVGTPDIGTNDYVDNCLLSALYKEAVDFLITEDKEIHKKAVRLGISGRVLFLQDAILLLKDFFDETPPPPPAVQNIPAYELDEADPIFTSLRKDYAPHFDDWIKKCKREGRDVYIITNQNGFLGGLIILKQEATLPDGTHGKTLKICTLKVSDGSSGQRYGELLLKTAFEYADRNSYQFAYFTAFPDKQALIDFCISFGFEVSPFRKANGEYIVFKRFAFTQQELSEMLALDFHIKFGPLVTSYTGNSIFIIPIVPEYHNLLFPKARIQTNLFGEISNRPCGNSIKKAYLSHSRSVRLNPGDNILFYRSKDSSALTVLGIVEDWIRSRNPNTIAQYVGTRTVYKFSEIEQMCNKPVLAIKFRFIRILHKSIPLRNLVANGIVGGPPQSITLLNEAGKEWVKNQIAG